MAPAALDSSSSNTSQLPTAQPNKKQKHQQHPQQQYAPSPLSIVTSAPSEPSAPAFPAAELASNHHMTNATAASSSIFSRQRQLGWEQRQGRDPLAISQMRSPTTPEMNRRLPLSPLSSPNSDVTSHSSTTTIAPTAAGYDPDSSTTNLTNNSTTSSTTSTATARPGDDSASSRPKPGKRSSSSSSLSRLSNLSSRFNLPIPLRSRKNHIADFHIRPDEPHKKYTAGEHVRGAVVLVIVKPLRLTHLTVSLNGYARVLKEPGPGPSPHSLLPSGGSDTPQYHGNGMASLFQDEQVLSGDGRLDPGKYEFKFDLVFPSKGLPSSIEFERGTISYLIMATLTRPTAIGATTVCDTKITLVDKLDVGLLAVPRPRAIFLEPLSKRTKRKKSAYLDKAVSAPSDVNDLASEAGSATLSATTEERRGERNGDQRLDQSDILSEVSGESGRSASTGGLSRSELAQQVVDDKTITATVELLKGGCLPGDTVSVRISVQHIKRIKSMAGIIVTLFRQGRIDSAPPLEHFGDGKDDKKRGDKEHYPKSRAGLGGLSISSQGSTSIFRKDLDQNTAPLIVHPTTLQACVTVSVKVPDDSFPTIKGVPGSMIGFKYQIEVLLDLGGKLSNQLQGGQTSSRNTQIGNGLFENGHSGRGNNPIIDTSPLRREKGVISMTMETIIGTVDSSRGRVRPRIPRQASPSSGVVRMAQSDEDDAYHTEHSQPEDAYWNSPYTSAYSVNSYFAPQPGSQPYYGPPPPAPVPQPHAPSVPSQPYPYSTNGDMNGGATPPAAPEYVPSPQVPDERNMTEKERIQQAEHRLLPSQPPVAGPSSPNDASDENIYDADHTPRLPHATPSWPSDNAGEGPSAPTEDDLTQSAVDNSSSNTTQDKQEVERQRLMGEASAPPEVPEDAQRQDSTSRQDMAPDAEPSAPVLDEEDEYNGYGVGAGPSRPRNHYNEQLPAYER